MQQVGLDQISNEDVAGSHGADGMRRGGADADGEQIESRDDSMFVVGLTVGACLVFIVGR